MNPSTAINAPAFVHINSRTANHPMMNPPPPDGYTWGLRLLYLVFVVVVAALYGPCQWFARVKARRRDGWLRYL